MQDVIRKQIMADTYLTCVKTDKFKTCCLSLNLITKLDKETAAKNALLPRVLIRGTSTYPDMESINNYLDELYGARIVPMVRKKGELHCIGFLADFIDDDFVPKGENILEKTSSLLGEMLLSPNTHGGLLLSEYVDSERKNLIDDIRAGINDKRSYSIDRLFELMCADEAFGTNKLGSENQAEAITAVSLTKHYRNILASSKIEIFYCGAHDSERVEAAVRAALSTLPRNGAADQFNTYVKLDTAGKQPRSYTDKLDVNQGKLTVGFRLGKSMLSPNYAAMMVFNAVFGASVTSKLFLNVREKLSLCYYASSIVEKHKGIMAVASGVEFAKFDEALKEILAQLDAIKNGDISDWELLSARRAVITSIKSTMDKPSGLEDLFFDQSVASIKITPDELAALADGVTLAEIKEIASSIELDTVYYLTGTAGMTINGSGGDTDENKGYDLIREQVYSEKLENGLSVFVIPKRGYNKSFAFFATDYGGADRRFKLSGQWIDTPMGVAHFLEHKMFDTKDGNALTNLSANGASPNAFTSSDITAYHFESTEKFEENLEILLGFVSVPYFTPESVQKEQGIIGQEIRMTEDEPDYAVYYGLMKSLYQHNPLRDSVAGTVESIAQITSDTLYNCHNVFYNPSNMVLCVAGDVDPEKIVAIARKVLPKEAGEVPERDYGPKEKLVPESLRAEHEMEVSIPIFLMGSKVIPVKDGRDYFKQELIGTLALEILAGHSSPLYLKLYKEGLINSSFSAAYEAAAGASYVMAGGESAEPDKVFEAYKNEAQLLGEKGPNLALFNRLKKAMAGRQIRSLNSFDSICYNYARGYFRGYDAYEAPDVLNGITPEDVTAFVKSNMTPEKMAISIIKPRQAV